MDNRDNNNIVQNNEQTTANAVQGVAGQTAGVWFQAHWRAVVGIFIVVAAVVAIAVGLIKDSERQSASPIGGSTLPGAQTAPATGDDDTNAVAKPKILDIGSTGCGPCRQLAPILEQLEADYSSQIDFVFYEAWYSREGEAVANQYGVTAVPTLIFLDTEGTEVKRLVGVRSYDALVAELRNLGWIE